MTGWFSRGWGRTLCSATSGMAGLVGSCAVAAALSCADKGIILGLPAWGRGALSLSTTKGRCPWEARMDTVFTGSFWLSVGFGGFGTWVWSRGLGATRVPMLRNSCRSVLLL